MTSFLRALTEALVWDAVAPLSPPEREATVDSVTGFLHGQLHALPSPVRGALRSGMAGFRASVLLRERQRFTRLPAERRADLVLGWACGA